MIEDPSMFVNKKGKYQNTHTIQNIKKKKTQYDHIQYTKNNILLRFRQKVTKVHTKAIINNNQNVKINTASRY